MASIVAWDLVHPLGVIIGCIGEKLSESLDVPLREVREDRRVIKESTTRRLVNILEYAVARVEDT